MKLILILIVIGAVGFWMYTKIMQRDSITAEALRKAQLISLLNTIDNVYIASHQKHRVLDDFFDYASDEVISDLQDDINYGEEKLFGTSKYRVRTWEIVEDTGYFLTVQKFITHRHIKVNRSFDLAIGENFHEIWRLRKEGSSYRLIEIIPQYY